MVNVWRNLGPAIGSDRDGSRPQRLSGARTGRDGRWGKASLSDTGSQADQMTTFNWAETGVETVSRETVVISILPKTRRQL